MWPSLSGPEKFALRVRALAGPNACQDAVTCWGADFGKALHMKTEATEIDLLNCAGLEGIARKAVHQDAVLEAKESRQNSGRDMDAGICASS